MGLRKGGGKGTYMQEERNAGEEIKRRLEAGACRKKKVTQKSSPCSAILLDQTC